MYNQLIRSFGWNSFKNIFCEYETQIEKEFESEEHKWNEWIARFSSIVGINVEPLFYFWGVPFVETKTENTTTTTTTTTTNANNGDEMSATDVSGSITTKATTTTASLVAWISNDEFTQMFPQRLEMVKQKYADLLVGDESLYSTFG